MDCLCSTEILRQAGVGQLIKLVAYRSDVRRDDEQFAVQNRLIYRIKDRHVRIFEYFLAKQLVLRLRPILRRENWTAENSLLTYCPRGRQKRLETGTDQSERIGKIVAKELGIPFVPLIRRVGGQEQKMLGGTARAVNARGGFAAARGADAAGKQVMLLDDIVTTGASMAACANVVWDVGAVRILAVSLAQTEA